MSVPSYVRENVDELKKLVVQFRNQPQEKRVKALLLLKSNPADSFTRIAAQLGCSPGSISRWLKRYRVEGLEGLLRSSGTQTGYCPPLSALHSRTDTSADSSTSTEAQVHTSALDIQDRLIEFLHHFPVNANVGAWCREVRDLLQLEFEDVDRITINLNTNCDLLRPDEYHPRLAITQDANPDNQHKGLGIIRHNNAAADIAQDLIREFERQGYPVDRYHPPFVVNLEYRGAYLGTIFLWREHAASPISQQTIEIISRLEQFFVYAMSDMVLRHHYMAPVERAFYYTLGEVSEQASLTPQEHRVMTYRLLGYMYKEIAAELNISQDGVKKALQQIYRKTGTGSHIEFFAKYFAARILPSRSTGSETTV